MTLFWIRSQMKAQLPLAVLIALLPLMSSCQDAGRSGPLGQNENPGKGQFLEVTPEVAELLTVGDQIQLKGQVRDALGKAVTNASVKWETLAPTIATVDFAGKVTGKGEGLAEIRATYGSLTAVAVVAVARPRLREGGSAVSIYPRNDTIARVGEKVKLLAVGRDDRGSLLAGGKLRWESTATDVATVEGGTVTGVASGTAKVIVKSGNRADTATVMVAPSGVAQTVRITPKYDTIPSVGGVVDLKAAVLDGADRVMDVKATWSSLDPNIAVVEAGRVIGGAKGIARIRAAYGSLADTARVWVAPVAAATSLYITPKADTIPQVGGTLKLVATLLDSQGQLMSGTVTWSTMDAGVATVDAQGNVKGVSKGQARVTARFGSLVDTAMIWVAPTPPPSASNKVVITPDAATIAAIGQTVSLDAVVYDKNGDATTFAPTWSSLDPLVATVANSNAATQMAVTGNKSGKARIVATYNGVADTAIVTVATPAPAYSVVISKKQLTIAAPGDVEHDGASVRDASGSATNDRPTWSVSDPTVLQIVSGTTVFEVSVKALKSGSAKLIASFNGVADTADVVVGGSSGGGSNSLDVVITPSQVSIQGVGQTATLDARVYDGGSATTMKPTWLSLDPNVAQVASGSPASTMTVTAMGGGTARVVAKYDQAADTALVAVTAPGSASSYKVQIGRPQLVVPVGGVDHTGAAVKDAQGNELPDKPTWSVSDPTVLQIVSSTTVTEVDVKGLKSGSAKLIASYRGAADTANVVVGSGSTKPAAMVEVQPAADTIAIVGGTLQLSASVLDVDRMPVSNQSVTWSSLDPSVATVDGQGKVTGVTKGTARIRAVQNALADTAMIWVAPVSNVQPTRIDVTPSQATVTSNSGTTLLTAKVYDASNNVISGATATWSSLSPSIASVNSNGVVTGQAPGTAKIVAAYATLRDTAIITVNQPPPPPTGGAGIVPANLKVLLGPLVPRGTSQSEPIKTYDQRLAQTEATIYQQQYIGMIGNPSRDQLGLRIDANHYGALRSRLAWSLRNGLPLNANDTNSPYGRGIRMLRDYMNMVAKPDQFASQAHRGTGLPDIEAWWVLEGEPDARTYIHVQAMKYTYDMDGTLKFQQSWSDARQVAVALQAFSAAHRLGIPFTRNSANNNVGFDTSPGSWKAAGERQIQWIQQYIVKPNGMIPSPAHQGAEAYLFNAMLATELLKWDAFVAPNATARQLAQMIMDNLIRSVPAGWETLPYRESEPWPAPDLAAIYVWPALAMWQDTGDPKYKDFALMNLKASHQAYITPLKQWNQTFSTGAQSTEAMLAGISWR